MGRAAHFKQGRSAGCERHASAGIVRLSEGHVQGSVANILPSQAARRFRRHDSRLTAIWTFHRHGSPLRDQDRAPFGGQLGVSTPNCLAYEAGAEALPLWEEIWPGPAMKLVGPLAARSPGLRLALALEIERHCSADEIL